MTKSEAKTARAVLVLTNELADLMTSAERIRAVLHELAKRIDVALPAAAPGLRN